MHDIALFGAGRIGRIHAANIAAHPGLRLSHVVDPAADAAAELAARHGAVVADADAVFADAAVVGVVIASATDTHLDFTLRAVEAGKAAFCEKPIDSDLDRAEAALPRLTAPGARVLLGFNRRFDPHFQSLKARLDARTAGALETLHIISHDPAPPPIDYVRVSGGIFKDMAIHDFDMARFLLGEEPVELFASAACLVDPAIGEAGDFDTAKTVLRTAAGRICVISNSRRSGYGYDQRIEAFCSDGMLRAGNVTESTVEHWSAAGAAADRFQNFFLDRYAAAYAREVAHFADILAGTATPLADPADGVAALHLAEAATRSATSGVPVRL